jgi:hypothetical protein
MRRTLILKLALAATAILGLVFLFFHMRPITRPAVPEPPLEDASAFKDTTNVVFIEQEPPPVPGRLQPERRHFSLSASNEVVRLVSAIRLQRKEACPCGPHFEATFQRASGEIHVSFCDHCFDVLGGKDGRSYEGACLYRMPKDFYREFRRIVQSSERWYVPEP